MKKSRLIFFYFVFLFLFLFASPKLASAENYVIIDPGHGGKFSGTTGYSGNTTGIYEKHNTLQIALKLREALKGTGIKVFMTRETDSDFLSGSGDQKEDLINRMAVANSYAKGNNDNSIFISIHHNAVANNRNIKGFETYYYSKSAAYDPEWPPDPIQVSYENESRRLANLVHPIVYNNLGLVNLGIGNDQSFFVIRNAQMPSILVEVGYMTNPQEEARIKSASFQQEAAESLAQGIIKYFQVYKVIDYKGNVLKTFTTSTDAINFAKTQTNVYVLDNYKQKTIYSNISNGYSVFQKDEGFLDKFVTYEDALAFAQTKENSSIVNNDNHKIVWSTYLEKPYLVKDSSDTVIDSFYEASLAIDFAKQKSNTKVVTSDTQVILWTNISGLLATANISMSGTVGHDRYGTAVEISKKLYPNGFAPDKAQKVVVLANGLSFADALSVGPLAAQYDNAPILLTRVDQLTEVTKQEIQRLKPKKVIIIGGTGVVSESVIQELNGLKLGLTIDRIGGQDRYETNALINAKLTKINGAFVAYGLNYADALAAAPIASANNWAIVLSKDSISEQSMALLKNKPVRILGGTAVVPTYLEQKIRQQNPDVKRLSGSNRYITLASILQEFSGMIKSDRLLVSTGQDFPDALTASSLSVKTKAPLILVGDKVEYQVEEFLYNYRKENRLNTVLRIGGAASVETVEHVRDHLY